MLYFERWISLSVHCVMALYMFSKLLGSWSIHSYVSEKPRICYLKYGIQCRPEDFLRLFPYVVNRCAPSHYHMKISRFGDKKEWRYSMLPGRNMVEVMDRTRPCWAFVFVGFSKNLSVELQIKRTLYCKCEFIGINNKVIPDVLHFIKILEHLFISELDDMYAFLPELLHRKSFEDNLVIPCQVTLDLPLPNTDELTLFMRFIQLMIEERRHTMLSVQITKSTLSITNKLYSHNITELRSRSHLVDFLDCGSSCGTTTRGASRHSTGHSTRCTSR
uniref:DUF4773 domain-containing protein n=1 Tax=Heterorhabditis bacteriophora TaxID=37862 RepID=A0A1I7WCY0_HETBA